MTEQGETSGFQKHWMPSWEAEKELKWCQDTRLELDGKFRSGRDKWRWVALNDYGQILAERDAMQLTSKKGRPYVVVSRYPRGVWGA